MHYKSHKLHKCNYIMFFNVNEYYILKIQMHLFTVKKVTAE